MRTRIVAIDCGNSRCVVGAFVPGADGELMLAECAQIPRDGESAWAELPASLRRAGKYAVAPAANLTLTKTVAVPRVVPRKREQIVRFEAERAVPRPLAEVVWDWTATEADPGCAELVAMRLDAAETLADAAQRAGARLQSIVPRATALRLAVRHNYPELTGPVVVVEVDGATALLATVGGGRPVCRLVGLPEVEPVAVGRGAGADEPGLRERRLAVEVGRLLEPSGTTGGDGAPATLLLAGNDAPEAEVLGGALGRDGLRIERFDALRRVRSERRAAGAEVPAHGLGVAVGTALALCGRRAQNLLPPARRRENAFRRNRVLWLAATGVAVALLVGLGVWGRREVSRAQDEAQAIVREMEPWRAAQREAAEVQRQLDICRRELGVYESLGRSRASWARFLDDAQARLARAEGVWFETLQLLPLSGAGAAGGNGTLFGHAQVAESSGRVLRLRVALTGCALDPGLDGRRGLDRVRALLHDWAGSDAVAAVEAECFDSSAPGLLRFGCVLVLKPEAGL